MKFSVDYLMYINSPAWQRKRRQVLDRANNRCQVCNETAYQVHHNTYKRLGHEELSDLIAVCGYCHRWITFAQRLRRFMRKVGAYV